MRRKPRNRDEEEELQSSLSRNLREARIRARLTQVEVAEAIGVCEHVYARYERAQRLPSVDTFDRMCLVLGCSANWLLGEVDEAPAEQQSDIQAPDHEEGLAHDRTMRRVHRRLRKATPETLDLVNAVLDAVAPETRNLENKS